MFRNYVEAKSILRQETVQVEEDLWIGISDTIGWLLKVHRSDDFGSAFVNDLAPFLQVIVYVHALSKYLTGVIEFS